MRNLILRADWDDFILFDDYEAAEVDAHILTSEMRSELSAWNAAYRPFLGLSQAARKSGLASARLAELDARGRELAGALKSLFPGAAIRYAGDAGGLGHAV